MAAGGQAYDPNAKNDSSDSDAEPEDPNKWKTNWNWNTLKQTLESILDQATVIIRGQHILLNSFLQK